MLATQVRLVPRLTALPYFTSSALTTRSLASLAPDQQRYTQQPQVQAQIASLQARQQAQLASQLHQPIPSRTALRIRRAETADYTSISALIDANRGRAQRPADQAVPPEGNIAARWSVDTLAELSSNSPGFWVAEISGDSGTAGAAAPDDWRLAGVALASAPGTVAAGPAGETNTVAAKHFGNGYYLYGPVVVDTAARAHGVLRKLSQAMFEGTKDSYSAAVAFIEDADHVSRVVHQRLGWKQVDEFKAGGSGYHVFWHATGGVA